MKKIMIAIFLVYFSVFASENNDKKNILFIAVDDLKPVLGCYGDTKVITPNIDKLAAMGTVFENAHCQQAVCAPSRASIMTGKRPDYTKVWDLKTQMRDMNPDIKTLPQYLISQGYETASIGKIFDFRAVDKKHDEASWSIPHIFEKTPRWLISDKRVITEAPDLPNEKFVDGEIAAGGLDLLNTLAKGEKPFFLGIGFKKPHLPFVAPKKYWDLYNREEFELAEFQEYSENTPEFAFQPSWELRGGYDNIPENDPLPKEMQLEMIHGYYACVSFIDDLVGQYFTALDELGLKENTIIVFWGDHGWHLGDHSMWCKHTNFEQSTRVPLIFSSPDTKGGIKNSSPTEFVDVFPTLCDLAGVEIPNNLDGVSLSSIMKSEKTKVKNYAVSQFSRQDGKAKLEGYTLRTEQFRYTVWVPKAVRDGEKFSLEKVYAAELYDYKNDPLEKKNHINEPEYKEIRKELEDYMNEYFAQNRG
ncbi:MAG: sulfatase [Melioribacteraceae bacterium]|nr:sulfatase [Melioribacteraceae bacterium]